jgi:FdhD protein
LSAAGDTSLNLLSLVHQELRRSRSPHVSLARSPHVSLARLAKASGEPASSLLRSLQVLAADAQSGIALQLDESTHPPVWRVQASAVTALEPHASAEHTPDGRTPLHNTVAQEAAVALVFNGISHAVLMASPHQLSELARGFAWSEGIVGSADGVRATEVLAHGDNTWEVACEISAGDFARLKNQRRSLAGSTGCGLCGLESLQALHAQPLKAVVPPPWLAELTEPELAQRICQAADALPDHQPLNAIAGSLHAAAWCGTNGQIQATCEDVGRHNALDKLLGSGVVGAVGFVLMSSRASIELVRKCVRAGVPLLATVSAPTALAIQTAQTHHLQLWGMARGQRVIRYA